MKKIIILSILFLVGACSSPVSNNNNINNQENKEVACTMEAMECPDGSYVGRVAPDCNFAPCPEEEVQENEELAKDNNIAEPVDDFFDRITKKEFGQYITRQNSPVQPERFSGFHTGVDIEYSDVSEDVPVYAIADGVVVSSRWATGYGGVMIIKHNIKGQNYFVVYGHLDPASMSVVESEVEQGNKIAILGDDKSNETDGERKHLHFAVYKGNKANLLGYVQSKEALNGWLNPLNLYK